MKTAHELMSKLDQLARRNGNLNNNDILKEIQQFEKEIRKDQVNKCAEAMRNVSPSKIYGCAVWGGDIKDMNRHEKFMIEAITKTIVDTDK